MQKSIEIEKELLGALLAEPNIMDEISGLLNIEIFSDIKNKTIFKAINDLYESGKPIDEIAIYDSTKTDLVYLSQLRRDFITSAHIQEWIKILTEKWMLKKLQNTGKQIEVMVNNENSPFEIIESLNAELYQIENNLSSFSQDKTIWGEFQRLMDNVELKYSGDAPAGLQSSSFPSLNLATGGIMDSDLIVIYGKDKSSKTTFTERLILDFAFEKIPIGIFPMEMSFDTYALKAYSMIGNIEYLKLRNPRGANNLLDKDEFKEFYTRAQKFSKTKIYIDDSLFDFEKMISKAKMWKKKYNIGVLVFDYLGLIKTSKNYERRDLQLSEYTGRLKGLAKEIKTPIIVVSQANDDKKTADGKGAMRDGDFSIYLCKPVDEKIKSIKNSQNKEFLFNDNHFLATIERSRHGKNKQNFVCGFTGNDYKEIDININSELF